LLEDVPAVVLDGVVVELEVIAVEEGVTEVAEDDLDSEVVVVTAVEVGIEEVAVVDAVVGVTVVDGVVSDVVELEVLDVVVELPPSRFAILTIDVAKAAFTL
jgi:hypothetical protein